MLELKESASNTIEVAVPSRGGPTLRACVHGLLRAAPGVRVYVYLNACTAPEWLLHLSTQESSLSVVELSVTGYASARNAILQDVLDRGMATHIIFFDDDQLPVADWYTAFLTAVHASVDVACGPVVPIAAGRGPVPADAVRGNVIPMIREGRQPHFYTGNTLIRISTLRSYPQIQFDPRCDIVGGEDTLFFRQLLAVGARLQHVADALAVEMLPRSRLTLRSRLRAGLKGGRAHYVCNGGSLYIGARQSARALHGLALLTLGTVALDRSKQSRGLHDLGHAGGYLKSAIRSRNG